MDDTTEEMRKKQIEIMLSKTMEERFRAGMEMIDFTRAVVEESIKREHNNGISELELKKKVFVRYYSDTFTEEEQQRILKFFH